MLKFFSWPLFLGLFCVGCSEETPPTVRDASGLYLPADLEATVWAETPMLHNPTNMDVDHRGRIWVTEAVNYRSFNNDSGSHLHYSQGDRVLILEDTDEDGKADKQTVFVQDSSLVSPVGIAVFGNQVVVSCSPNLIVFTDTDGDDHADRKEILLTGFGGFDHDHSLHAVYGGPDGHWIFNTGNAGPHVVTDKSGWTLRSGSIYTGGSPYNERNEGNMKSDDSAVWVGGLALRMQPDGKGLKVMGHNFRNSYEVFPDSYGNLWQNDNDDQVVTCRTSWLMEGGNAGYFSTDGTRYWQADQRPGQDIFSAHWHQDDPGTMPAGDRTGAGSPTGVVRLESDLLGKRFRGMLLSADAGRNLIFGYTPVIEGSGYGLGKRTTLFSSIQDSSEAYVWNDSAENKRQDRWFRPSDVTVGTEGAIYIADWYDPVVGGHQMMDSIGFGRIYRIAPKRKKLVRPVLEPGTLDGQLEALKSPAINVRFMAQLALIAQGDKAIRPLKNLLTDKNPFVRARAVWTLSRMGPRGVETVEEKLAAKDPELRAVAIRALRQTNWNPSARIQKLLEDPSPFVRRELIQALTDWDMPQRDEWLWRLAAQYPAGDRWYLEALGAAMEKQADHWYAQAKKAWTQPNAKWSAAMTDLTWRLHPATAVADLDQIARDTGVLLSERRRILTALGFVMDSAAPVRMLGLAKNGPEDTREEAAYWLSFRQSNDWYALMDWSGVDLNTAYRRKLSAMQSKAAILFDAKQSDDERSWRAAELCEDSVGGQLLVGLASRQKIPAHAISFIEPNIFKNPDPTVRVQAGKYFKRTGGIKTYDAEKIGQLKGDQQKGKAAFQQSCGSCHRYGKEGADVGPDLTQIGGKFNKSELIDAILNPSAGIVFGYEPWLIQLKDESSLYGFLVAQNKKTLTLKSVSGKQQRIDIANVKAMEKQKGSLMPDPSIWGLEEQQIADISAFLLRQ